jgi:hypothetical protein
VPVSTARYHLNSGVPSLHRSALLTMVSRHGTVSVSRNPSVKHRPAADTNPISPELHLRLDEFSHVTDNLPLHVRLFKFFSK